MDALEVKAEEMERGGRQDGNFLSAISHGLKTPLHAIDTSLHLLSTDREASEEADHYLEIMRQSSADLLQQINQILDYSRLAQSKVQWQPMPVDLPRLMGEISQKLQPLAAEKGLDWQMEWGENSRIWVEIDPDHLSQILQVLLHNAIKFTTDGQVKLVASIVQEANQAELEISVIDTGQGLEISQWPQLIQPFAQGKRWVSGRHQGVGLGLSVAEGILKTQGRSLEVVSSPGSGATVFFRLPVNILEKQSEEIAGTGSTEFTDRHILIVEDNEINARLLKRLLESWGLTAEVASDGKKAIEQVSTRLPDMILMDLQMPVLNGFEAAEKIRKLRISGAESVPIIALTASTLMENRRKVMQSGMNDLLSKPVNPEEIRHMLETHLPVQVHEKG
ncbi:MAG: response regulator [Bacteroidota bacterium]